IARAVAKRLLHEPTARLRALTGARRHAALELVRDLFVLAGEGETEGATGALPSPGEDENARRQAVDAPDAARAARAVRAGASAVGSAPADEEPAEPPLATVHSLRERRRR
ncbi:MAG: hypothetical protein KGJ43_06120, partial [Acidobacteriota bacterium]|nr:hypothetical protein [Acidobacteriota bacterium]